MQKLCAAQWTLCSGLLTRERMCAVSWSAARYALVTVCYLTRNLPLTVAAGCPYH